MGAGKWKPQYTESLRGADVVLIGDNDATGIAHVLQVATELQTAAKRIRVLDIKAMWPECPDKGDISDWLNNSGGALTLSDIVAKLPDWVPSAEAKPEGPRPLMREMPPADPFPVDALGTLLANAATGIQDRVRTPAAICAQSVLAVAWLVTQGRANVKLPTGQVRPLSGYFGSVAVTGERKSAADNEATWPIRKHEENLREAYGPTKLVYDNKLEAYEAARKAAVTAGKGNVAAIEAGLQRLGPPPVPPLIPRLICSEPTAEGLVKLFAAGWPSLGLFSDEGGGFIGGHGMSEDAKLRTARLWDGAPLDRVRGGDGALLLPGRRLATHLMVQPNVAAIFLGDGMLAEQGLLSRFLVTYPDSAIGGRMWRQASDESDVAIKAYGARMLAILEKPLPLVPGKLNELSPPEIALSAGATAKWVSFHDHVEANMREGRELWPVRGLANKIPEIAARLAGCLTLVENINATDVSVEMMDAGIALAEHYLAEALRLHAIAQADGDLVRAEHLLLWLRTGWESAVIGLPEVYQYGPNFVRDAATAKRLVGTLEDHGHLIRIPGGAIIGENRRRDAWTIIKENRQ
jgi:Protein of unknown function (DUF3987)